MRLELGTFPVTDIRFGPGTRYDDHYGFGSLSCIE